MNPLRAWDRFWFSEASLVRLAAFRILVMTLCLADLIAYSVTNFRDSAAISNPDGSIQKPWNPIYLFEVLGLGPPGIETTRAVFLIGLISISMALVGLFTRFSCAVAAVVVIWWSGVNYSFSKAHHDKVTLAFVVMVLPLAPVGARLSLDAVIRGLRTARKGGAALLRETSRLAAVPILLTQLTISIGYGFSGATKLVVRGLDWANGYTLMGILMHYSTEWSDVLSHNVELARFLSLGTLFVQTTFPIVLLFPALRWFYLPSAVAFHLGTWMTMDTGPYMTLWFLLMAFLPLERIPSWMRDGLHAGSRLRAAFVLAVTLVPTALVVRILFYYFPSWAAVLFVPPAIALFLYLCRLRTLRVCLPAGSNVAMTLLTAADWARCLKMERISGSEAVTELTVLDTEGHAHTGFSAWQRLAPRLPLLTPLAWLLLLVPGPTQATKREQHRSA